MTDETFVLSENETQRILRSDAGDAAFHIHKLFPGVDLIYDDVHLECCRVGTPVEGAVVEIRHCREGRLEQQTDGGYFYLTPGDLSIAIRRNPIQEFRFPLRHYHGIAIVININSAPKCFSCLLQDVHVQPLHIAQRLCGEIGIFTLRRETYIEHIFSEMYSVPDSVRRGYLKVKVLELLLMLSVIQPQTGNVVSLSFAQVALAREVAAYLAERIHKDITVAQLAEKFHVSQPHLQKAFKGVYGTSVFAYGRMLKMQSAAIRLIQSDAPITEIALGCGYENPSKFASAFQKIMGETPMEYRKAHWRY